MLAQRLILRNPHPLIPLPFWAVALDCCKVDGIEYWICVICQLTLDEAVAKLSALGFDVWATETRQYGTGEVSRRL